jgi:hypothetical protein
MPGFVVDVAEILNIWVLGKEASVGVPNVEKVIVTTNGIIVATLG